jgi:hypothetical protein
MGFAGKIPIFLVASRIDSPHLQLKTHALRGGRTQGIRLVVAVGEHHQPRHWVFCRWDSRDYKRNLSPILMGSHGI